jgi:hypothetical protein
MVTPELIFLDIVLLNTKRLYLDCHVLKLHLDKAWYTETKSLNIILDGVD